MKGFSFQKGVEYRIETIGEKWQQGDPIEGKLSAKSASGAVNAAQVVLAHGTLKKVHAKSPDAFDIIAQEKLTLSSGEANWKFPTTKNSPITDVSGSLFLLYGPEGAEVSTLGQLQLNVVPAEVIAKFLDVFQIHFRFVLKFTKTEKNGVQAKLVPPEGNKQFSFLEHLILRFSFSDDDLSITYEFNVLTFDATVNSLTQIKKKKKREVAFTPAQYKTPSGRWNDDLFEKEIAAALDELDKNRG